MNETGDCQKSLKVPDSIVRGMVQIQMLQARQMRGVWV